jgi:hypothetical protein
MAQKLVSMKIDRAAQQEKYASAVTDANAASYPYGLEVRLDNDSLEKLGIDVADLEVGGTLLLRAKVEITNVSKRATKESGEDQSATLQITKMCLEPPAAKSAASTLYKE